MRLRRTGRCLAYLITAIVIASTASAGWIAYLGFRARPSVSDCIIILGCGLYGSTPSPFLMARLDEGIRLFREGYAHRIIVSGGRGPGENITEAEAMKDYLVAAGVPGADIITEGESTSTLTSLTKTLASLIFIFYGPVFRRGGLGDEAILEPPYHYLLLDPLSAGQARVPPSCSI